MHELGVILGIGLAARFVEVLFKIVFTIYHIPGWSEVWTA